MRSINILQSHEAKRFIKVTVTTIFTSLIAVYAGDPSYMLIAPIIDRVRAMVYRKLNID